MKTKVLIIDDLSLIHIYIRESLLVNDTARRQQSVQNLQEHFGALEESVAAAEKRLISERGRAEMARFKLSLIHI